MLNLDPILKIPAVLLCLCPELLSLSPHTPRLRFWNDFVVLSEKEGSRDVYVDQSRYSLPLWMASIETQISGMWFPCLDAIICLVIARWQYSNFIYWIYSRLQMIKTGKSKLVKLFAAFAFCFLYLLDAVLDIEPIFWLQMCLAILGFFFYDRIGNCFEKKTPFKAQMTFYQLLHTYLHTYLFIIMPLLLL